jgi:hypothetical protein
MAPEPSQVAASSLPCPVKDVAAVALGGKIYLQGESSEGISARLGKHSDVVAADLRKLP